MNLVSGLSLATVAALMISLSSCSDRPKENKLHSPARSLLGYHLNLPNSLVELVERGVLGKRELQDILKANNAWFAEQKRVEALPFMPGRRRGADADPVLQLLLEKGHGNSLDLKGKDLRWANLTHSTEQNQDLSGFQMVQADLSGIHQPGFKGAFKKDDDAIVLRSFTDLSQANMLGAELKSANLSNTDLRGSLMIGVDLTEARLRLADLYGADLRWAVFDRTDLSNADVGRTDLTGVRYEPSKFLDKNIYAY